jgi:putative heme iron utilization protein
MSTPPEDGKASSEDGRINSKPPAIGNIENPAPDAQPGKNQARGSDARRFLRRFRAGVLGTHSLQFPGYPYGSAMPFCTDQQGRPIVLISHLAEHTRNVAKDGRISFTVSPLDAALQQEMRATVLGEIAPCDDNAVADRYLRFFPDSRRYLDIGGFHFHTIEPRHVRLIAGFGSLHWLSGAHVLAAKFPIADAESDIVDHMTADHHGNLVDYCRHFHSVEAEQVQMIGIDCDGFDLRASDEVYRIDFETEIRDAQAARAMLVSLANIART